MASLLQRLISRGITLAVLVPFPVVGCSERDSRWTGTVSDSAGVTIISNPAEGIWTETDEWTVEEELRIGVREGDPEYQFAEIAIGGIHDRFARAHIRTRWAGSGHQGVLARRRIPADPRRSRGWARRATKRVVPIDGAG